MKFVPGHHGRQDQVGGLPTHLPPEFPRSPNTGKEMAFLAQLYCDSVRLPIDEALCVQLYQGLEDYEPLPVAIVLRKDAPLNESKHGTLNPEIEFFEIEWALREDPEFFDDWQTDLALSKAGGVCYFMNTVDEHESLLLQVNELPVGFNFGGFTAVVVRTEDGRVEVRLA
jgi:hypothetical protein